MSARNLSAHPEPIWLFRYSSGTKTDAEPSIQVFHRTSQICAGASERHVPIRTYEILTAALDAEPRRRLAIDVDERVWDVVARQVFDLDQTCGALGQMCQSTLVPGVDWTTEQEVEMRPAQFLLQICCGSGMPQLRIRETIASSGPTPQSRIAFNNHGTCSVVNAKLRDEVKGKSANAGVPQRWPNDGPHEDSPKPHHRLAA